MPTDIPPASFWQKIPFFGNYAVLARLDRPVGYWLLFWPCLWGLALAPGFKHASDFQQLVWIVLFFAGAVVMRGAGCVVNDLIDRKIDAKVARTKDRPLASGAVSVRGACVFLALLLLMGAAILLQLSQTAILIGLCTLPLIAVYPLMKRVTWLPQLVLGIVFNAGALIGWAAVEDGLSFVPVLLYLAAVLWTVGYDTVYAFLDAEDDARIGMKSTALLWGPMAKTWTGFLFVGAHFLFFIVLAAVDAGALANFMAVFSLCLTMGAHLFWHPGNTGYTLGYFRFHAKIGFILALSALAPVAFP